MCFEKLNYYSFEDRTYSQVCVEISLVRDYGYYMRQVIMMVALIVLMSWSIFFMPASDLAERTGITVTLFLAAIAFNFVVGGSLPKISYNTKLDSYLLTSYLLIAASLAQNVIGFWMSDKLGETVAWFFDVFSLISFSSFYAYYSYHFVHDSVAKQKLRLNPPKITSVLLKKDSQISFGGNFDFKLK